MIDTVTCPNCGAQASGKQYGLPVIICGSCNSILRVSDDTPKAVGDAGEMPFDVSPLQIGTTLKVGGKRGEVVGRERWGYDRGFWNEWLLHFSDGSAVWVAEEAGFYMVMEEVEPAQAESAIFKRIDNADFDALDQKVEFRGHSYTVADIKAVKCIASEGVKPDIIQVGQKRESIDFRSQDKRALTWQSMGLQNSLWMGRYLRLETMKPQGLRVFEHWSRPRFGAAT